MLRPVFPTVLLRLPDGPAQTEATLIYMRDRLLFCRLDPQLRDLAASIVSGVLPHDHLGEAEALFEHVRANVRYLLDVEGAETIADPLTTLSLGYGDCDDMCLAFAGLCAAIGLPTKFCALAFKGTRGNPAYSHVIVEVSVNGEWGGAGDWIAADPIVDAPFGWRPPATRFELHIDNIEAPETFGANFCGGLRCAA